MRDWPIYFWLLALAPAVAALQRDRLRPLWHSLWRWLKVGMWRPAAQNLLQNWEAGRALIQQKKWGEAVAALDRALALVHYEPALEAELQFHRGYVLEQMGQLAEASSAYLTCQMAESDNRAPRYGHVAAFRRGYLLVQLERWREAEASLRASIEMAGRTQALGLEMNARRILLGVYQSTREHTLVIECTQQIARLAGIVRDESIQAMALDAAGDAYLALGQHDGALRHYERSLDLFLKQGNAEAGFVVKQDIAKLYRAAGQWEKAVRWSGACLREEEQAQNWRGQARIAYDLGCLYIHQGELGKAGGYLQHSMGLFRQAEDRMGADMVGRTMMGLSILMHREATSHWLTSGEIERGSAKSKDEEED